MDEAPAVLPDQSNIVRLDVFSPRPYQLPLFTALEQKGFRRILFVWPRRAGKDLTAWVALIRQAIMRIGVYMYVLPTYNSARKIIWDNITIDGIRMLDYIPDAIVESRNEQSMRIRLKNQSIIQLVGSNNYDNSLVGTNPIGIIFSEYSLQSKMAYMYARPILAANNGFAIFLSTPRGRNHLWELYNQAIRSPEWYVLKLTVEDTKHISLEDIERDIANGEISREFARQEYWCFPAGQGVLTVSGCKGIETVVPNDMVVSHSGRMRKVIDVISREYDGELIEISSFGSSENILCTPNHPIRVYDQATQTYEWKEAQHISEDDRLVFPKMSFGDYRIISYELCMLIAWYISDGSAFKNGLTFTVNHVKCIRVKELLSALSIPFTIHVDDMVENIVINSVQLVDFFKSSCGLQANNKRIPFNLIATYEDDFFHELMKGDGCHNISKDYERFVFGTVSKTLAYQVQILANSLHHGYAAGISSKEARTGIIHGRMINCQKSYQVNIGFAGPRVNGWLIRAKNCIAAKIKSIDRIKFSGPVYNLKIQYDESYIVAGRAVHNCDFDAGQTNSFYGDYMDRMFLDDRIGTVLHNPSLKVHTAWDIGVFDSTVIIMFQVENNGSVRIINYFEKSKEGIEFYVATLNDMAKTHRYNWGMHIFPFDMGNMEFSTGQTRVEKARQLGLKVTFAPRVPIMDGIECVRTTLPRMFIDEKRCGLLIKALQNYRQEYDEVNDVYASKPVHDRWSHAADSVRYLCLSLNKLTERPTAEDYKLARAKALGAPQIGVPSFFSSDGGVR